MFKYSTWALLLTAFLISSCNSHLAVLQQDKHESSVALNEIRSELSDLRHELNNSRVEIQILEEQLHSQEALSKKTKTISPSSNESHLEKRLALIEQAYEKIHSDLKQISSYSNQTKTCLQQYSTKISELEQNLERQNKLIHEVGDLKSSLKAFTTSLSTESSSNKSNSYKVKAGDSLDKIARNQQVSVEALKRANNLSQNKILIGQELLIP